MVFLRIHFRTFVHATESEERVKKAMSFLLDGIEPDILRTEGHFGNPLTIMEGELTRSREIKAFLLRLGKDILSNELVNRMDERMDEKCVLHLRLDKNSALDERMELAKDENCVHVSMKTGSYPANKTNACKTAAPYIEELINSIDT